MKWRIGLVRGHCLAAALGLPLTAQQTADLLQDGRVREIGPTRQGGRFVDFAVVESDAASSTPQPRRAGSRRPRTTASASRTCSTISPSRRSAPWPCPQSNPGHRLRRHRRSQQLAQFSYWGDGVYKSHRRRPDVDPCGLKDSQHIGRIVVHPTDPNTAYVAALGPSVFRERRARPLQDDRRREEHGRNRWR